MDNIDYFMIFVLTNVCAFSVYFTRKLFKLRCTTFRCCGFEFIQSQPDIEAPRNQTTTTSDSQPLGIMVL